MAFILQSFALYLYSNHAYYISVDTFYWPQAEAYCSLHCNSHLASIHSKQDHQHMIHQISNLSHDAVLSIPQYRDTWIGLHRSSTSTSWIYSDSTSFDFGNPPISGIYPWSNDYAQNKGGIKVQNADDDYLFDDRAYDSSSRQISCNHCDSILTKYVVFGENYDTYNRTFAAQTGCRSLYGTGLASIHSERDWAEIISLCTIFNEQWSSLDDVHGCFIGLQREDNGDYLWDDGTTFDFATDLNDANFWASSSGDRRCINLDDDNNYVMHDTNCRSVRYSICHMPSEVCYENKWRTVSGSVSFSNIVPCGMITAYADINIHMIYNTRWQNHGASLVFDYTFAFLVQGINGAMAGIILHMDTICANYYYIGVSITDSTVFLALVTNEIMTIIDEQPLGFTAVKHVFYLLGAVISDSNTFSISVNDNMLMSNIKASDALMISNTKSAYIGIRSTASSIEAKSLYISGEKVIVNGNNPNEWFADCIISTSTTTAEPTTTPSIQATAVIYFTSTQPSSSPLNVMLETTKDFITVETSKMRSKSQKSDVGIIEMNTWIYVVFICVVLCVCCSCVLVICLFCKKRHKHKQLEETDENMTEVAHMSKERDTKREKKEVKEWLTEIGLAEYYKLFIENGYESMKFIKGIDDKSLLKEIGIKKLGHQTILWVTIKKLQCLDATTIDTDYLQPQTTEMTQYATEPGAVSMNNIDRKSTWGANSELPSSPHCAEGEQDTETLLEPIVSSNSEQMYIVAADAESEENAHETLGRDINFLLQITNIDNDR